jgi:hypothetical protein
MHLKPSRFTEEQIIGILREHEAGAKMADIAVLGQVLPSLAGDGMRGGLLLTAPVLLGEHRYENSPSRREIRRNSFVH